MLRLAAKTLGLTRADWASMREVLPRLNRQFTSTSAIYSDHHKGESAQYININWKKKDGSITTSRCRVGENLMRAAQEQEVEIEGACEGVCACSTCHVILQDSVYETLPEASEREEDMLDQAVSSKSTRSNAQPPSFI